LWDYLISNDLGDQYTRDQVIDWTHELKWRIPSDAIQLIYKHTYVLLRDHYQYKEFMSKIQAATELLCSSLYFF
jgi:hypothetical protein